MPRSYKKKTERAFPKGDMQRAVEDVLNNAGSLRQIAELHSVTKSRLAIYVNKARKAGIEKISFTPYFKNRQVFSDDMEDALRDYLLKCSKMFYGLTPKKTRQLAYQFAIRNSIKIPESWKANEQAGEDWFTAFLKRNPLLSIRKPEATSLARMTAFNKTTVGEFFHKLEVVLGRFHFEAHQIFNLDETGVTTVPPVEKVVAKKGEKQVGAVTSRERGELITQVGIICANGNALPPIWVFPRIRFDENRMMRGTTPGSLGLVHKSGWMTADNFISVLEFFKRNVRCSKDNPVLLLMDNHESHLSVEGISFAKSNGIIILTLPPHTSNKLQPLDRSVFGPFKKYFNEAVNAWMLAHPNETITIYSLPELCSKAWDRGAVPANVKSGFRKTGICPFDRNIFEDHEYLCSAVSDRPPPEPEEIPGVSTSTTETILTTAAIATSSNSDEIISPVNRVITAGETTPQKKKTSEFISPEEINPFPKAKPRKISSRGRKRGRCMIATDTPEKEELENKQKMRELKKIKAVRKKVMVEEDSSDEDEEIEITQDSSSEWEGVEEEEETFKNITDAAKDDFLIVKVPGKTPLSGRNYVARVKRKLRDGFEVDFFKRLLPSNRFQMTGEESSFIIYPEVVSLLPKAIKDTRPRFKDMLYFNIDLTEFNLQ